MDHLFGIGLGPPTLASFVGDLAEYCAPTEAAMLQAALKSVCVHAEETGINIQGVDHHAWVFADGRHVVCRLTETREADIVREALAGSRGVLVSASSPGDDGVPCRRPKGLVHLVRALNDDLWAAPFDKEREGFAVAAQPRLVPLLEAVDRSGLKAWHPRTFAKEVERFSGTNLTGRESTSEAALRYQKRFIRYRGGLFTFLTRDGIPRENDRAERAVRQLAVPREVSGAFFKRVAPQDLRLLATAQTCRFQGKSFLKFLLSQETDVDSFRRTRPVRSSDAVPRREASATGEGQGSADAGHDGEAAEDPGRS
jgi:hypothetical protein